jgi:MFS family permease
MAGSILRPAPTRNTPAQSAALLAGSLTLSLALGSRASFGLFLVPLDVMGIPLADVALAIAMHNLSWGLASPLAGAWADRRGATSAQMLGAALYALGFGLPALVPATWSVMLGMAFLGWGVALAGVTRAFPPERRSSAAGLVSAGGSVGQMLMLPVAAIAISYGGGAAGLLVLGLLLLVALPLGRPLDRAAQNGRTQDKPAPRQSLSAVRHARWASGTSFWCRWASSPAAFSWRSCPPTCPAISACAACRHRPAPGR